MLESVVLMQSYGGCYTERLPVAVAVARPSKAAAIEVSGKRELKLLLQLGLKPGDFGDPYKGCDTSETAPISLPLGGKMTYCHIHAVWVFAINPRRTDPNSE